MAEGLKRRVAEALANESLRSALDQFARAYPAAREAAFQAGPGFEVLREEISRRRREGRRDLPELIEAFIANARRAGAEVFRARDADEANRYIADLARGRGVRRVVKSKSMATEEIGLNEHLEGEGIAVRETDRGEWIIQLAGHRPSHMVLPAVHLSAAEVARVLGRSLERDVPVDVEHMVALAREELRRDFLEAGMGITGANMAVASTGSLVLVTNEGNARLATSLPPVHVAVVGYEKLVRDFEDVEYILAALPPSATGQIITSYVSVITGPTPRAGGPGELHIVLLDNGRQDLASSDQAEAMQCIRCAACLNVCPVYRRVGGHVFGHVYSGGIGAILTAFFWPEERAKELQELCSGCGRCTEVCPAGIDIPGLILDLRARIGRKPPLWRLAARALRNPRPYVSLVRLLQAPWARDGFLDGGPGPVAQWTRSRSLPTVVRKGLDRRAGGFSVSGRPRVAFYGGCLVEHVYPEVGEAAMKYLARRGHGVFYVAGQGCCGAPARHLGVPHDAEAMLRQQVDLLAREEPDFVVTVCPTCAKYLREGLRGSTVSVMDLSSFLVQRGEFPDGGRGRVTYHESCHSSDGEATRELLERAGFTLLEMREPGACCGFAGAYSFQFPEISGEILADKLADIASTGAEAVVVDCPGCLLNLRGGLRKKGSSVRAVHLAELLLELD